MGEEKKVTSEDAINAVNTLKSYCNNWRECTNTCIFYDYIEGECSLNNGHTPNLWRDDIILINKEALLKSKIIDVLQEGDWPVQVCEKKADKIIDKIKDMYGDKLDD